MDKEGERIRREEWESWSAKNKREKGNSNNKDQVVDSIEFEFHGFNHDEYRNFANFSPHAFTLKGVWPTANHYFQAMKFEGTDAQHQERIRAESDPFKASMLGKQRCHPIRHDWDEKREEVMTEAVFAKFSQNEDIQKLLLSTGLI